MISLIPKGNDKCGLLNRIINMENGSSLINIPENAHSPAFVNRIQTIVNCSHDSDWPSNSSTPYLSFDLINHFIKPTHVSITRRFSAGYPILLVLEAPSSGDWIQICSISTNFVSRNEVLTLPCSSNRFFSTFRLSQTQNSNSLTYLEFNSFDIFGYMVTNDNICYGFQQSLISSLNTHQLYLFISNILLT